MRPWSRLSSVLLRTPLTSTRATTPCSNSCEVSSLLSPPSAEFFFSFQQHSRNQLTTTSNREIDSTTCSTVSTDPPPIDFERCHLVMNSSMCQIALFFFCSSSSYFFASSPFRSTQSSPNQALKRYSRRSFSVISGRHGGHF